MISSSCSSWQTRCGGRVTKSSPSSTPCRQLCSRRRRPLPDAIVLDIKMPGAGMGLEGSTDPDMPDKVRVAVAVAFLGKPVDPVALCDTLGTVLGKLCRLRHRIEVN